MSRNVVFWGSTEVESITSISWQGGAVSEMDVTSYDRQYTNENKGMFTTRIGGTNEDKKRIAKSSEVVVKEWGEMSLEVLGKLKFDYTHLGTTAALSISNADSGTNWMTGTAMLSSISQSQSAGEQIRATLSFKFPA
jgi:hypothetical protein